MQEDLQSLRVWVSKIACRHHHKTFAGMRVRNLGGEYIYRHEAYKKVSWLNLYVKRNCSFHLNPSFYWRHLLSTKAVKFHGRYYVSLIDVFLAIWEYACEVLLFAHKCKQRRQLRKSKRGLNEVLLNYNIKQKLITLLRQARKRLEERARMKRRAYLDMVREGGWGNCMRSYQYYYTSSGALRGHTRIQNQSEKTIIWACECGSTKSVMKWVFVFCGCSFSPCRHNDHYEPQCVRCGKRVDISDLHGPQNRKRLVSAANKYAKRLKKN